MLKLQGKINIELKQDLPEIILYLVPELSIDSWIQVYDMDMDRYSVYGNKAIIIEYLENLLEDYER